VRVPFQPVEQSLLLAVLAKEKVLTKAQRALAARVAAGSVARAKSFDLAEYEKRRQPWLGFLEAVTRQASPTGVVPDWPLLFDSTRALAENRDDFDATLKIGYSLLRDLLYVRMDGSHEEVVNLDLLPALKGWAAKLGLQGIEQMKVGLDQAYRLQVRNVNQQLGLEALGIDLATGAETGAP
jgi:hypothetical protein